MKIDDKDRKILFILQKNAAISEKKIAELAELPLTTVNGRIRKLREQKIIKGIVAQVNPAVTKQSLCVFLRVKTRSSLGTLRLMDVLEHVRQVMECHHTAGEYGYLIKARFADTLELESFVDRLRAIPGISGMDVEIVLSTMKESMELDVTSI